MSVQIIKWIILLFVTGNCLSETCKANDASKVCLPVQSCTTIINQADNMLASLVSFLHFNAGDLTEEHTKKMPDKKLSSGYLLRPGIIKYNHRQKIP